MIPIASLPIALALAGITVALAVAARTLGRPARAWAAGSALMAIGALADRPAIAAAATLGTALLFLRGLDERQGDAGARYPCWVYWAAALPGAAGLGGALAFPDQRWAAVCLAASALPFGLAARSLRPIARPARIEEHGLALLLVLLGLLGLGAGAGLPLAAMIAPASAAAGAAALLLVARDRVIGLERLALTDPLTGALNRRGFADAAARAFADSRRHGRPLVIAAADLDHFKTINDRLGHAAGDGALIAFARAVEGLLRRGDLVARTGGEEFCMLLSDASEEAAARVVERVRAAIAALMPGPSGEPLLTASFGVSAVAPEDDGIGAALARADAALYRAKREGRNRIVVMPVGDA